MSLADIYQVFGPAWEREIQWRREQATMAEQIVLALRRRLRSIDPTLPDEYDGTAWWPLEQEWAKP